MATSLSIFNVGTNTHVTTRLVSASLNFTGVWHNGVTWFFYNGSDIYRYRLIGDVFSQINSFNISGSLGNYVSGTAICGQGDNLFVAYKTANGGTFSVRIAMVSNTTGRIIKQVYAEAEGVGSVIHDITHDGTRIHSIRRKNNLSTSYEKVIVDPENKAKAKAHQGSIDYRSICNVDSARMIVGKQNLTMNAVSTLTYRTVGVNSATGAVRGKASCLVDIDNGSTPMVAILY